MSVVYQILFSVGKIVSYLLIVLSFVVSGLILFRPALAARLNDWFNAAFCTKKVGHTLDSHIDTTEAVLRLRWWIGGMFLIGSLFTLKYLLVDFDDRKFVSLVLQPRGKNTRMVYEMIFHVLEWFFIICSSVGVLTCLTIMFRPDTFRAISEKLDTAISTAKVAEALDAANHSLDAWVLKHHTVVGLFLFLGSCYLVVIFLFVLRH